MAGPGRLVEAALVQTLVPMVARWRELLDQHPAARDKLQLHIAHPRHPGLVLDDWLSGLRSTGAAAAPSVWIELQASKIANKTCKLPRADKLLGAWIRCLASAAMGRPASGILIGADAMVQVSPPAQAAAVATLSALMQAWHEGLHGAEPLPTAVRTGLAFLQEMGKPWAVFNRGDFGGSPGEGQEACLARLYPDYAALSAESAFEPATRKLYEPYAVWLAEHVAVEALPDATADEDPGDE